MAETALNFGPDWIRALASGTDAPPTTMPIPRYKLADYRYGREEMLALIPKDTKIPESMKQFEHLAKQNFQIPLALTPMTEDEQCLWSSRYVNSEASLRGKTGPGGYGMNRIGRGGSMDRGRGRGRGGYYQRGLIHEDLSDGPPFPRQKTVERSLSANEKDHRWDERDRRYDRTFSGRGGIDDTNLKHDNVRGPNEHWRKFDKDDEGDWRSNASRSYDKLGGRGSWRNSSDRERRDIPDRNNLQGRNNSSGNIRGGTGQLPRHSSSWKEDSQGNLPEWSVEEVAEPDTVGTFDSSGAFLETKSSENNTNTEEIYASDDADEGNTKQDSPEAKKDSSKKTAKKSSTKLSANKKNTKTSSDTSKSFDTTPAQNTSEPSKSASKSTAGKPKENVSQQNALQNKPTAQKQLDFSPPTQPSVPTDSAKSTKVESVLLGNVKNSENAAAATEEDAFAYHQKATENMVAQWTEEIEQRVTPQKDEIHPTHPEKDSKWYYQDPQGEIQGPFASHEMLEWFSSGYFTMSLMVRRSCDETFSQLGDLIKSWGRVPFMPGSCPPPVRVPSLPSSLSTPIPQPMAPNLVSAAASAQLPKPDEQLLALQQQLFQQQLMQQQLMLRQAQMQQLLTQLKQQDNFTSLNSQQQQQVLMQQFMAQIPRPNLKPMDQSSLMDPMNPLSHPLLGLQLPPMMKSDMSMWQTTPEAGAWPVNASQPPGGSIWDVDLTKPNSETSELEKQKKLVEEQERLRKSEELRIQQEMEEKRKQEDMRRKQEEEEERKRVEEIRRQEAERQLKEELKRLEDLRREEEERRCQEELQRQEELRKQEELRRQEEKRRQEEEKRQEELRRKEELRKMEETKRQQELKKMEEKKKKEEMMKKQLEKEREKQLEIERQKEALRQKELEREERLLREKREKEELELRKLAELKIKTQGPVWGIQKAQNHSETSLSLADIQRLQEEKEREEKEEKMRQQLLQQQAVKQVQVNKNGLTWAKRANDCPPVVKSLSEIQQEEAERLAQLSRMQKPQAPAPTVNSNAGVWGNSSHLNKITAASSGWNATNNLATTGFWDDALISTTTQVRKQPPKSSDNAFPSLANPAKPAVVNNSKSKNARAKKEEDAVTRLFGSHRKPTDEFTKWCTEAISAMPSSVDVPTFVAFLKDIESPYEVHDYVKSYFGEGKEPKEFATLFLEKRSKYRNQAKQAPSEDNSLWGPAPAITPIVNKPIIPATNDVDGNSGGKGKAKKKKGKMQKLDNSLLGFTVQPNPDRINAGEIDHIENNM